MKKLSNLFKITLILCLMATPAFSLSYKFDFNGDEDWDTAWILQPPPVGETVQLELWLDDNYICPPSDDLLGVSFYFSYDASKIQINQIIPNDDAFGGPFDSVFTNIDDNYGGVSILELGKFEFVTIGNNKILLFTLEVEALELGSLVITASDNVGFPFDDGFVLNCYNREYVPPANDGNAIIYLAYEDSDLDGINDDGDNSKIPGDNPCTGGNTILCDDNCPDDPNPDQENFDNDTLGDICDPDDDNDTIPDVIDNCPKAYNTAQEDTDNDTLGDVCDNCPDVSNLNQQDTDSDGTGDLCDTCTDTDMDGYGNPGFSNTCEDDNCPDTPNGPGGGTCINVSFVNLFTDNACTVHEECGDILNFFCDKINSDQNGNGIGDACECYADCDNNTKVDIFDLLIIKNEYNRTDCPCDADLNEDGKVDIFDLTVMRNQYNRTGCPVVP